MSNESGLTTLLTQLEQWAEERRRVVDLGVLEQLLELRFAYDGAAPTSWPAGSVTDLLLKLWPAKGDGPAPEPEAVAQSFDTSVKFLRNTGRMAAGSADPKELAREARRAAPKMAAAEMDRSQWSPGKVIGDHAKKIGLDFDGAESLDDLNARLALANTAWNSLPVYERQRLMPLPGDERISGRTRALDSYGTDDPAVALVMSMRYELPKGPLPDPEVTAPYARRSELLHDVLRMMAELPDRIPVTSTGVLKPTMARQIHHRLGLSDWEERSRQTTGYLYGNPKWRSARDLLSLNRLWTAAATARWIDVSTTVAYVDGPPDPLDDGALVQFGAFASIGIMLEEMDSRHGGATGLLYALLRSYVLGCGRVSWNEIGDFLVSWEFPALSVERIRAAGDDPQPRLIRRTRNEAFTIADAGVIEMDENGLALTPLGDVFVTGLINHLQRT